MTFSTLELPSVSDSTPSVAVLATQIDELTERFSDDLELVASLKRLRAVGETPSSTSDLTVAQLATALQSNPGLKITLSFCGCK